MNRRKNRRLGFLSLQLQNTEENLQETEGELQTFTAEFDVDMDYQANKAGYERLRQRFEEIRTEQARKPYFLRNSKFVTPTFETVASDLEDIMDFGRIVDNCEFSEPLITMNTYNFELLEYKQSIKDFQQVPVKGNFITLSFIYMTIFFFLSQLNVLFR